MDIKFKVHYTKGIGPGKGQINCKKYIYFLE